MFERVWDHILVSRSKKSTSYFFLKSFEDWMACDKNPLYALLHESIYCQGAPSKWVAHRIRLNTKASSMQSSCKRSFSLYNRQRIKYSGNGNYKHKMTMVIAPLQCRP